MTDIAFENKHPRGEAGKFAAKEGSESDVNLPGVVGFKGEMHSPRVSDLTEEEPFDLGYGNANDEESERLLLWVESEGVTGKAEYQGFGQFARPDGGASGHDAHNYSVTLTTDDGREFSVEYHMGSFHQTAPTVLDVLQSSASDAHGFESYDEDEFLTELSGLDEYGSDEEQTREGDAFYAAVRKQAEDFREFAGDDYDHLLYGE